MSRSTTSDLPTSTSLVDQMEARQASLGITNHDLCTALGFDREIVLTMIKQGSIKMPLNKIPALAVALELDAPELLRVALRENDPTLSQLIEDVFNPLCLTATEVNLIKHLRELTGDRASSPIVFDGRGVIALVSA